MLMFKFSYLVFRSCFLQILMLIDQINKYSSSLGFLNAWNGRSVPEWKALYVTLTGLQEKEPRLTHHGLVAVRIGFARVFTKTHSWETHEVLSRMESLVCPESDTGVTKEGADESLKRLLRPVDVSKNRGQLKGDSLALQVLWQGNENREWRATKAALRF